MYRSLKMVIYEQLARKYAIFRILLHKEAEKYG